MTKSKFQKRKEREKEVRKKILTRRTTKHAKEKENAKFDAEAKAVQPKQHPILNSELYEAKRLRDMEIKFQLEHNMKLLEGLQKEYEEELKKRAGYLEQLQDQVKTLEDDPETYGTKPEDEASLEGTGIFDDPLCGNGLAPTESLADKAVRFLEKKAVATLEKVTL